jgi:hydrogenase maturation protease
MMRTLVLGIGNPILSDDGVGVRVVERLMKGFSDPDVDFRCESVSGLDIIEVVRDYDKLIIVDAIQTGKKRGGEIMKLAPSDLLDAGTVHFSTLHDVDMLTALSLGKEIGAKMPENVVFYAIEVANVVDFGENLSPDVAKAVPEAVRRLRLELATP